ncbi:MAG: hypothetical protein HY248_05885 [Fimbriimonas ginsengisoli]|nr:hypothetical protein [Fimbriimonas ginsengisoli]
MQQHTCRLIGIIVLSLLNILSPARGGDVAYRLLKEIPVGGDGGWDYLTVDEAGRRLYVSRATKLVVIDLDQETILGEIADTPGVHGIAVDPGLGRGFTSNGREDKAGVCGGRSSGQPGVLQSGG